MKRFPNFWPFQGNHEPDTSFGGGFYTFSMDWCSNIFIRNNGVVFSHEISGFLSNFRVEACVFCLTGRQFLQGRMSTVRQSTQTDWLYVQEHHWNMHSSQQDDFRWSDVLLWSPCRFHWKPLVFLRFLLLSFFPYEYKCVFCNRCSTFPPRYGPKAFNCGRIVFAHLLAPKVCTTLKLIQLSKNCKNGSS